jgi:hypothetical protein
LCEENWQAGQCGTTLPIFQEITFVPFEKMLAPLVGASSQIRFEHHL